jgi:hypothetical protein
MIGIAQTGTGKTLAVDVIHKLATGRLAGKFTMPIDRKGIDEAELRKILASVVQSAAASILSTPLWGTTPRAST